MSYPPTPEHPDRPAHPDFKILADIVWEQDRRSQSEDFEKIVGEVADPDVVTYVAENRALALYTQSPPAPLMDMLQTMWLDGLQAGFALRQKRLDAEGRSGLD